MGKVVLDMSMSLDGIGAGPNPNEVDPMDAGGERLHAWFPFDDPEHEATTGVPRRASRTRGWCGSCSRRRGRSS